MQGPQNTPAPNKPPDDKAGRRKALLKALPKKFYQDLRKLIAIKQQQAASAEAVKATAAKLTTGPSGSRQQQQQATRNSNKNRKARPASAKTTAAKTSPTSKYMSFPLHFYSFMYTPGKRSSTQTAAGK